jgi:hypothetical protein
MLPGGTIDFSFCIVCDHRDGTTHKYWDSQVAASLIPKTDRAQILDLLLRIVRSVLTTAEFPEVTMYTYMPNLPAKALAKYRSIEQVFINLGYSVATAWRKGYRSWRFTRRQAATAPSGAQP